MRRLTWILRALATYSSELLFLLVSFGHWLLSRQFFMQILLTDGRDEKGKSNGNRDKDRRGHIRITKPTDFVQSLEDVSCQAG